MKLQRLLRLFTAKKRKDLEWYPPWWTLGIEILGSRTDWRHVRIRLPLGFFTRNLGGSMFGGAQANLADPIAAIACANLFTGYTVWTRALTMDFRSAGNSDLELRFDFDPELEERIRKELAIRGRSTPTFEYGYYRSDGVMCTHISATVAIRPRDPDAKLDPYTPPGS
jgi:acyl-coenzyme A thioesterase PaaI-like protein